MVQKCQSFLNNLNKVLNALVEGDFKNSMSFSQSEITEFKNTIGLVNRLFDTLSDAARQANVIAEGDYTVDIKQRSDKDELGIALQKMTQTLREASQATEQIALGNLDISVEVRGEKDLLGQSINKMVVALKAAARQANIIASGDYTADIKPRSEKDELGIALQKMTHALRKVDKENKRQAWLKTGQNELNQKMRGDQDIVELSRNIIAYLAKYLNAQIGALYLFDEASGELQLKGSYAFTKRKEINNAIAIGEGLVGQAAFEKEMISISSVPEDYTRIGSATGNAVPRNVVVSPFLYEGKLSGVIELGSFQEFSDEKLDFLKIVMENIAIGFNSALARNLQKKLLLKTQQQAEELEAQQEQLKATNAELEEQTEILKINEAKLKEQQEELQAANEELEEQTETLKQSEEKLKIQQEELQAINEELEEKTEYLEKQSEEIRLKNRDLEEVGREIERKAEELEISSKYKSEFLANMSHELRTPLNSLLLLARNLMENREGTLTDDQVESAEIIYQSGNDLLSLINEILDLSKIESGKMILNVESFEIGEIADNLNSYFRHMASEKGLNFAVNIANDLPPTIHSDRQRVEQIIKNLVSNALKFTAEGGVTISFFQPGPNDHLTLSGLAAQDALGISVTDTGIGIPEDKQKAIFEAFQQADGSTSRQYGGTGLGLSISKELAKLLGGEIQLVSTPGGGSTFTLFIQKDLPMQANSHPAPAQSALQPKNSIPTPPQKLTAQAGAAMPAPTIKDDRDNITEDDQVLLVIEDDLKFARVLYKFAHEKNFKCLHAGDGESGLAFAKKYKPDAIILDINLPGIEGWEVLDALKDNNETRHIPVHMMSVEDETLDAFRKGAIGYLTKPVTQTDLNKAFKKIQDVISKDIKEVLIVEDNQNTQKGIMKLLDSDEINQTVVSLGKEAVEKVLSGSFDCMILDLSLPDISGFEVLDEISRAGMATTPPIIIYTGRELTQKEAAELQKYTSSIVVKGARSEERLLDETALFLHRVVDKLPKQKKQMISKLHEGDALFKDKKILLVDDDTRNIFAVSKILQEKGMVVYKAANGQKALESLDKNGEIDLVLMDIMMPVMDGYEAMTHIREQKRFRNLPILALTAKAMKDDRDKCIAAGANDYLPKPVDIDKLLSLMRVWLYK